MITRTRGGSRSSFQRALHFFDRCFASFIFRNFRVTPSLRRRNLTNQAEIATLKLSRRKLLRGDSRSPPAPPPRRARLLRPLHSRPTTSPPSAAAERLQPLLERPNLLHSADVSRQDLPLSDEILKDRLRVSG